ncbi:MAG TPA: hypothetical protein DCG49_07815 [Ruminococcus sp.]|nr:hypothetical protein [Ruminococcus sp.]
MIGLWHEAARRLRRCRRSASVIGASRIIIAILCLLCGYLVQRSMQIHAFLPASAAQTAWACYIIGAMLTAVCAVTPLRMQTAWQLGRITGTLDQNDLGFLACSKSIWLWRRAWVVRLLTGILLMLSVLPAYVLYAAAKVIWLTVMPEGDDLLPLMTALHLGLLALSALFLPMRILAAETALPYAFLKLPHAAPFQVIRLAFRLSRQKTIQILWMRLIALPFLMLPFTAVYVLPTLLTAEQLRCERVWRHLQPRHASVFRNLELHAREPADSFR